MKIIQSVEKLTLGLVLISLGVVIGNIITLKFVEKNNIKEIIWMTSGCEKPLDMVATAYIPKVSGTAITRTGKIAIGLGEINVFGINVFSVAVDPKTVPLNSIVFIEGLGIGLVTDTGGDIKGNRIDICTEGLERAKEFGVKHIKVWIIQKG